MAITILHQSPSPSHEKLQPYVQQNATLKGVPNLGDLLQNRQGELTVAEDQVYWWCEEQKLGLAIHYKSIIIHAISRDPPSIYCQIDGQLNLTTSSGEENALPNGSAASNSVLQGNDAAAVEEEDQDGEPVTELYVIPQDPGTLDAIYQALCDGSALHPDADAEQDPEDDVFGESFPGENEEMRQAALAHLESVFEPPVQTPQDATVKDNIKEQGTITIISDKPLDHNGNVVQEQFIDAEEQR